MIELPVKHHARKYGHTKYGLTRTLKVILDLFTVKFLMSYANKPIYLFGGTGMIIITISALMLIALIIRRIFWGVEVLSSPFFVMSIMFTILGFQSILMGLIAELLARTYHESQDKPTYTILKYLPGNQDSLDHTEDPNNNAPLVDVVMNTSPSKIAGMTG